MSKDELIERLKQGEFFYIASNVLFIKSSVTEVFEAENTLSIQFEAGDVQVELENIRESENKEFKVHEWVYFLTSKKGEYLGMVTSKE